MRDRAADTSELKVSIAIASFNPGEYLVPALRSVLDQTYCNLEVLLIDDGGTDGAVEEAARSISDPRLRLIRQENCGKSVALNRALQEASGEFFCIMDADDISHSDRIARLTCEMESYPAVGGIMSGYDLILKGRHVAPISILKDEAACKADIDAFRMPSHDPTLMVKTSIGRRLQFEPELRVGQGYDFILRLGEIAPMRVVRECLYSYRIRNTSITRTRVERRDEMIADVRRRACVRRGLQLQGSLATSPGASKSLRWQQENGLAGHFIKSVHVARSQGRTWDALKTGAHAVLFGPSDIDYLKAGAYAVMPNWIRRRVSSEARGEVVAR